MDLVAFPNRQFLTDHQVEKLNALLAALVPANRFYTNKLKAVGAPTSIRDLAEFSSAFPFTTKSELAADQAARPPYGFNLTFTMERYTRCHQTSGTAGEPLRWLDTPESWDWMTRGWEQVYRAAGVTARDHVFCAFSFGPFLGFWLAFEAAARLGCMTLPGGGLSSMARLKMILDHAATVVCCTPTYAIHLAEVAREHGLHLADSSVRLLLVAGEPGGCVPATRQKISDLWNGARVFDHHGMTEVGPVTHECPQRPGVLHVMETSYLPEVIDPVTGQNMERGQRGELVLTVLGRTGSPLLRYRTSDLVQACADPVCVCGRSDLALEGGILGRVDDMIIVRGVNVYPSAVDDIVRGCGGIAEYRVHVTEVESMAELSVEIEPLPEIGDAAAVVRALKEAFVANLALRVEVTSVSPGALPRFEMKAKRWVRK